MLTGAMTITVNLMFLFHSFTGQVLDWCLASEHLLWFCKKAEKAELSNFVGFYSIGL